VLPSLSVEPYSMCIADIYLRANMCRFLIPTTEDSIRDKQRGKEMFSLPFLSGFWI
jgi:hypothetical protein